MWFGPLDPRNAAGYLDGAVRTVNRAKLSACIAALRLAPRQQPIIQLVTDSKYVYDGILRHLHRWRLQGKAYLNSDLWDLVWGEV